MAVTYSFPGGTVNPAYLWGTYASNAQPYNFPPVTVTAETAVAALTAIGSSACATFNASPPPGLAYCNVASVDGGRGVTVLAGSDASWSSAAGYTLTSVLVPPSSGGVGSGSVSGSVSLAPGSTVSLIGVPASIKLDAGPSYTYADITLFSGIALAALAAVWAVKNLVLRHILPH